MKKIITLLATTLTFGIFSQTTGSIMNESGNYIFSYQVDHVNCFGQSNGSINLTPLTNENWSYTWDNQQNSEDIENLFSGIYRVTIKNNLGQIYFGSFTVEQPEKLETYINIENDILDLVVSGGVEPYVYLWNTGDTTQDINYSYNGVFDVIVVDSNNCVDNANTYVYNSTNNVVQLTNESSKVYPNPSTGLTKIIINKDVKRLEILNSNSQIVSQQNVIGQSLVSLEITTQGIYLCNLISSNDVETIKIIIE